MHEDYSYNNKDKNFYLFFYFIHFNQFAMKCLIDDKSDCWNTDGG